MRNIILAGCALAALTTSAYAATTTMSAAPTESWTVANYYKQAVYDPKENKIGDVEDVLIDKAGKVTGLVIGVGGFIGADKDVIVPFTAVKTTKKNDKWWLTADETKDGLKSAPGFKYDKASTTWVPDKK